jgi:hypothetical protein
VLYREGGELRLRKPGAAPIGSKDGEINPTIAGTAVACVCGGVCCVRDRSACCAVNAVLCFCSVVLSYILF